MFIDVGRCLLQLSIVWTLLASASCAAQQVVEEVVPLTVEHPRVVFEPKPRKMTISLRMPVDSGGRYLVPKNLDSAIDLLKVVLPGDFEKAVLKDEDIFLYANSDYGVSVVEDVGARIALAWKLDEDAQICKSAYALMTAYTPGSCFENILFLYKVRNQTGFEAKPY